MRRMPLPVLLALLLAPHHLFAQASLDKQFQAREEAIVAAIKAKQYDKFQDMLDPTFTSVYGSGIEGRAPEVEAVKKVTIRGADLSEFKAHQLDPAIVLVTYKVKYDGSMGEQDVSGEYWGSSVWRKKDGKWLAVYHSEVKAEAPKAK